MWNAFRTDAPNGLVAGVMSVPGPGGGQLQAYVARPDGSGPYPGVVLIHHIGGWDEFYREFSRRFAEHGYIAICPNLFQRFGHGTPDDVAARARGEGYISDDEVVADAEAAMTWVKSQPTSNGKVGIIGTCSAGRHAVLVASRVQGFGAVADLWGGRVVMSPDQLNEKMPVAPIDLTPNLNAPLIGLFGNDDTGPSPAQVDQHEEALKQYDKLYLFKRYDGAGHAFFSYDRPNYRPESAIDGWNQVEAWFNQHLS